MDLLIGGGRISVVIEGRIVYLIWILNKKGFFFSFRLFPLKKSTEHLKFITLVVHMNEKELDIWQFSISAMPKTINRVSDDLRSLFHSLTDIQSETESTAPFFVSLFCNTLYTSEREAFRATLVLIHKFKNPKIIRQGKLSNKHLSYIRVGLYYTKHCRKRLKTLKKQRR